MSSFRDFAQKLANAGYVTLRENGRNVLVELKEGGGPAPADGDGHTPHEARPEPRAETRQEPRSEPRAAEAIAEVRRLFQAAPNPPRWPMYVRQVKQFLRGVDPTFDERNFGFQSLNDLLRACQREGLFRMERDRQGVMRFFQGNVMRPVDGEAGGTPESEAEAQIRHGREAAAAAAAEAEVVDGDVVQEIDATPPVIDASTAAAESESDARQQETEPVHETPSRGRGKRATKTASSPSRARKTASKGRGASGRKKSAAAAE